MNASITASCRVFICALLLRTGTDIAKHVVAMSFVAVSLVGSWLIAVCHATAFWQNTWTHRLHAAWNWFGLGHCTLCADDGWIPHE